MNAISLWNRPKADLWDMDNWFDGFFGPQSHLAAKPVSFLPAVDVAESDESYALKVDLPGLKKEDVSIELDGDTLTISGERKSDHSEKSKDGVYRTERHYGKFSRSFKLPTDVNIEKIEASQKEGVLNLVLPKTEAAKPKQIKIVD